MTTIAPPPTNEFPPPGAVAPPSDPDEAAYYSIRTVPEARIADTGKKVADFGYLVVTQDPLRYDLHFGLGASARDVELIVYGINRYSAAAVEIADETGPTVTLDEYRDAIEKGLAALTSSGRVKQPYARTDMGNAELLRNRKGHLIRWVAPKAEWLVWGRHRWHKATDEQVMAIAMDLQRELMKEAQDINDDDDRKQASAWHIQCQSLGKLRAMIELAKALQPIFNDGHGWDEKPDLVGCQNGVIEFDPQTGDYTFRDGRPDDQITKAVSVAFIEDAQAPTWLEFRRQIHPDEQVRAWTALAYGYTLTGHVREQVSFWAYGSGANGKGVEQETIGDVMGDYAWTAPSKLLIGRQTGENTNDVAGLYGRRFVMASEVPVGSHTNEQRLKQLTGGDTITARFLHQEYFEFKPTAKFFVRVNDKPASRDNSEGYWRRIRLVPYPVRFDDHSDPRKDERLPDKLKAEAEGIFAWQVRCASLWYQQGLANAPDTVIDATNEYRAENDNVAGWMAAATITDRGIRTKAREAHTSYRRWCDGDVEDADILSLSAFGARMTQLGIRKRTTREGVFYEGLGLLAEPIQAAITFEDEDEEAA
jgi:putative DNA primase/helicase